MNPLKTLAGSAGAATRGFLRRAGIELVRYRDDHHYVQTVYGRSAFKHVDIRTMDGFGPLATRVIEDGRTLLFYDRLYTLYQGIANLRRFNGQGPIHVVEAGVFRGGSTYFMAECASLFGLKSASFFAVDTFEGHAADDLSGGDRNHTTGTFVETSYDGVRRYLEPFENVSVLKGRLQDRAADLDGRQFHLVHLDMDIYEPTIFGLNYFDRLLVPGGAIIVDDYGYVSCPGAKRAVDEFVATHPAYFKQHLLTGQCLLVRS